MQKKKQADGKGREPETSGISDARPEKTGIRKKPAGAVLWIVLTVFVLVLGARYALSDELEITFHHLYSGKMACGETARVVVLSDLHNREFGPGNEQLAAQIASLKPDIIAIVGDMVNADDDNLEVILTLCDKLVKIAPVYYSPGNHENNLLYEKGSPLEELLLDKGVHVMVNRAERVTIHKTPFLIGSLTTAPEGYEEYGAVFFDEYETSTDFKLLLAHYPSLYYDALADARIDLGICGHYHGGQVRLPFIGGLYHGDAGLFPKYNGGMYSLPKSTIFVSRGMGGHSGLPRINNRPELAVIDINGRQETEIP
ncbi:MAG: hypothetical protein HFG73_01035 [Hungatella sp.]|nr:hypothetical protein [Hungatella sp.]